jgi:hypothetical protein
MRAHQRPSISVASLLRLVALQSQARCLSIEPAGSKRVRFPLRGCAYAHGDVANGGRQ